MTRTLINWIFIALFCPLLAFAQNKPNLKISLFVDSTEYVKEQNISSVVFITNAGRVGYEYRLPMQSMLEYLLTDDSGNTTLFTDNEGDWPLPIPNYELKPGEEEKDFRIISGIFGNSKEKGIFNRSYLLPGKYKLQAVYKSEVIIGSENQKSPYEYQSNEIEFEIRDAADPVDIKIFKVLKESNLLKGMMTEKDYIPACEKILTQFPESRYTMLVYSSMISFYSMHLNANRKQAEKLEYEFLRKYYNSLFSLNVLPVMLNKESPYYGEFTLEREDIISKLRQSRLTQLLNRIGYLEKLTAAKPAR